jgi:hypothetical protein
MAIDIVAEAVFELRASRIAQGECMKDLDLRSPKLEYYNVK